MASKLLRGLGMAVGIAVLAILAFIVVYLIGYGFYAVFSHSGMQAGTARGVGAGIAAVAAILLLAIYFASRRGRRLQEQHPAREPRHKRAS